MRRARGNRGVGRLGAGADHYDEAPQNHYHRASDNHGDSGTVTDGDRGADHNVGRCPPLTLPPVTVAPTPPAPPVVTAPPVAPPPTPPPVQCPSGQVRYALRPVPWGAASPQEEYTSMRWWKTDKIEATVANETSASVALAWPAVEVHYTTENGQRGSCRTRTR